MGHLARMQTFNLRINIEDYIEDTKLDTMFLRNLTLIIQSLYFSFTISIPRQRYSIINVFSKGQMILLFGKTFWTLETFYNKNVPRQIEMVNFKLYSFITLKTSAF